MISIAVNVATLSAIFAIFAGLLAIPMVEQTSEQAFGANWLFFILPRWLRYGAHGSYYCLLFFLALFYVSFFLSTQAQYAFSNIFPRRHRLSKPWLFWLGNLLISVLLVVLFYQENRWALWEKSLILLGDRVFVDVLVPLNALMTVGFLFFFSEKKKLRAMMMEQKVMFYGNFYFQYWRLTCCWLFPLVLALAWGLALMT